MADALKDLELRRAEAQNLFNQLHQAEKYYRLSPKEFSGAFDSAVINLIASDIKTGHISSANEKIKNFVSGMGENLNNALDNWRQKTKSFVTNLKGLLPLIFSQNLVADLNQQFDNLTAKINNQNSIN